MSGTLYLDNAATTPVLPRVVDAMQAVLSLDYGNPSSRHGMGLAAERHLRHARRTLARRVGADEEQVVFTSGGTEANGLAILGTARRHRQGHLLVSAIEHASVLGSARLLEREGFEVEQLPVTPGGWVDPDLAAQRVRPDTLLLAVMHVNNESGVEQPTAELARRAREKNPACVVLVDAVQSLPVLPVSLKGLGADLLTLSAHKIHGPKGVGCVVLGPGVSIAPLWGGGDQERSFRPGTENLPGIVGFAAAVELLSPEPERLARLTRRIEEAVRDARPDAYAVGDARRRAPHIITMALPGVPTEVLINLLESMGLSASSGSACHGRRSLRSHVSDAMGLSRTHGIVRLSLSGTTTDPEVERATQIIGKALASI